MKINVTDRKMCLTKALTHPLALDIVTPVHKWVSADTEVHTITEEGFVDIVTVFRLRLSWDLSLLFVTFFYYEKLLVKKKGMYIPKLIGFYISLLSKKSTKTLLTVTCIIISRTFILRS